MYSNSNIIYSSSNIIYDTSKVDDLSSTEIMYCKT